MCDGIDNNCNGSIDEGFTNTDGDALADCVDPDDDNDGILDGADCAPVDATKWRTGNFYADGDGDGYGAGTSVSLCYGTNTPTGYSTVGGDCNDADAAINPATVWYKDADGDGYSNGTTLTQCAQPTSYKLASALTTSGDCNDGNAAINPGAVEVCRNGIDDNCNGVVDEANCYPCKNGTGFTTSNITVASAQLNWTAIANPVQWQVQYKTNDKGSKWVDVLLTGDKRSVVLSSLPANQNYSWHIRAKCGNNWTSYSISISFKTLSAPLVPTVQTTVIKNTAQTAKARTPAIEKSAALRLYPNPSNGRFIVDLHIEEKINAKATIQLTDMTGRTVYSENTVMNNGTLQKEITISSGLAKGMYMVRIVVNNKIYKASLVYAK